MLLIMSENIARNMYSSQGIMNYLPQLHLVGHFLYCVMMHGNMNIKSTKAYRKIVV